MLNNGEPSESAGKPDKCDTPANRRKCDTPRPNNGDTDRVFTVGGEHVRGLGSFHKTLPHNEFGEVETTPFEALVAATGGNGFGFEAVPRGAPDAARLTNPQAGLAFDRLTQHPSCYTMPVAPTVLSASTAAEMVELYWMALLRDVPFDQFDDDPDVVEAATEINAAFTRGVADATDPGRLQTGVDVPGKAGALAKITRKNVFRLGLPGEEIGPLVSQFFVRPVQYGTQLIDPMQLPYAKRLDFLTDFDEWLCAQNSGRDSGGRDYPRSNEDDPDFYETHRRYISTPRDLARFVNKDALHQAYFNAALLLLSGGARWTLGNPYGDAAGSLTRQAGFGVLGGPHILALVSEVATRALKVVWNQKWQVHLRLRPEAYGGLVHVQEIGAPGGKRPYGLRDLVTESKAAGRIRKAFSDSLLLPMAFSPGSPLHPAYGAGHATVAGACVTVLKAYFKTLEVNRYGQEVPVKLRTLTERSTPFDLPVPMRAYITGIIPSDMGDEGSRTRLPRAVADRLTIEGELNKLAMNVAMGRSLGGVHWRTDNSRSLILGEALAARILADITVDVNEKPVFEFRTFARRADGNPKKVRIAAGQIYVDGILVDTNTSAL